MINWLVGWLLMKILVYVVRKTDAVGARKTVAVVDTGHSVASWSPVNVVMAVELVLRVMLVRWSVRSASVADAGELGERVGGVGRLAACIHRRQNADN